MSGMIVDLQCDLPALVVLPEVTLDLVACGEDGVEISDRRVHLVVEAASSILVPCSGEVSGSESDLIRCRANRRLEVDPVGIVSDVAVVACCPVGCGWHRTSRRQIFVLSIFCVF